MGGFLAPVSLLVGLGGTIQSMAGNLNRVDDILDTPQAPELTQQHPAAGAIPATGDRPLRGELELRGVTFGYSPLDPPLIEGLNLHLLPGQRVALVGASGSGKSTVSRLVSGLYEPWDGEILIDGVPRRAHDRAVLADGIALVDQEINLFEGTVRDNITLWDDGVPEADVVDALCDARLGDDILARPGGIASGVDEGGRNFSGGQRQRLEIARSLSRGPALLVLDEATSALDPLTEEAIDLALRRRGCTCLIVAHRLSTIRDSDEIVVLDKGKVIERGTHETLLGMHGYYQRLIES
jgi:ABC-type bacteriocin/lantibiotic exporter with double-glycine peptidase domain